MKLGVALVVYEQEGPSLTTSREPTSRFLATKVVHLYLSETERFELIQNWKKVESEGTRGPFLQKLGEVKTRLQSAGFI